jgi:putative phosphoribosyl transferase
MRRYANRLDAGRVLAGRLDHYRGRADLIVLGLARGGVPVAAPVATALAAGLDVLVVRKLPSPGNPELAMGAIAEVAGRAEVIRNPRVLARVTVTEDAFEAACQRELRTIRERERTYRDGRSMTPVAGSTVIVVDDGMATGSTMRVALRTLRAHRASGLVVAVPVGSAQACGEAADDADEVVCASVPPSFTAVGTAYVDFAATTDAEVHATLHDAWQGRP